MTSPDPAETIRALFRSLPGGGLRLRDAPTAKIDQKVLLQVFASAQSLKGYKPAPPAPSKPASVGKPARTTRRPPKK